MRVGEIVLCSSVVIGLYDYGRKTVCLHARTTRGRALSTSFLVTGATWGEVRSLFTRDDEEPMGRALGHLFYASGGGKSHGVIEDPHCARKLLAMIDGFVELELAGVARPGVVDA